MASSTISAATVTATKTTTTTITTTTERLSSADAAVLAALFDSESSLTAAAAAESNSTTVVQSKQHEKEKEEEEQHQQKGQEGQARAKVKIQTALELVDSAAPSRPAIEEAISVLDSLIDEELATTAAAAAADDDDDDDDDEATLAASSVCGEAYINRAQARRLLLHIDENNSSIDIILSSSPSSLRETASTDMRGAVVTTNTIGKDELPSHGVDNQRRILSSVLDDLSIGIRLLASVKPTTITDSDRTNQALANAFTHRGFILHAISRDTSTNNSGSPQISTASTGYAQIRVLENEKERAAAAEAAAADFAEGARRGNQLARKMSVALNPYAKLCGSIVREALQREMSSNMT